MPGTSLQSVYNALSDFADAGLVRRIEPAGHPGLFELRTGDNHHHLICTECGAITDVDCAIGEAPCLTPSEDHGYVVRVAEVTFWGTCSALRRAPDLITVHPAEPLTVRTAMTDSQKVSETDAPVSDHPVVSEVETESTNTTGEGTEAAGACPVLDGEQQQPHPTAGRANEKWWPNRLNLKILAKNPAVANPIGCGLRLPGCVPSAGPAVGQGRHRAAAHHLAGLVAGRLRQLRTADDPDGLALRRVPIGCGTVAVAPERASSGSHR